MDVYYDYADHEVNVLLRIPLLVRAYDLIRYFHGFAPTVAECVRCRS